MEKSNEPKSASKRLKTTKEKDKEHHRFTDKKRKNEEAKIQKLGGF